MLSARAEQAAKEAERAEAEEAALEEKEREFKAARRYEGGRSSGGGSRSRKSSGGGFGDAIASVVVKELKGTTGRRIVRGILGGLFRGR